MSGLLQRCSRSRAPT